MASSNADTASQTNETKDVATVNDAAVIAVDHGKVNSDQYRADFLASFTPEEEKRIMRKIDVRLLVLCGLLYMIKQIDVNNAASVKVLSPGKPTNILVQLSMTADQYNWVQSIYYISYIIFELPSNLLLKKTTPRLFQTRIMVIWGAILACHAAVKNSQGLLAARFFLGLAEAGLFPAIMTHCTSWYRSEEMGKPLMWAFGIFNFANIIGSILVYAMSFLDGRQGLSSWQWIFLLEGIATMAFGVVVYFLYPDYPKSKRTAKWLTPREQEFVELRLASNAPVTSDAAFSLKEAVETLKDPRLWSFMVMQVLLNIANFGLTWFLPTIITNLGFVSPPNNILLLMPPAGVTVITLVCVAFVLKKAWIPRPLFTMIVIFLLACVYAIFVGTQDRGAVYAACILGQCITQSFFLPFWSWRSSSLKGTTGTAFAFGLQSGVGQLGGVIGPQIFLSKYGPTYRVPFGVCLACICGALGACAVSWLLTAKVESEVRRVHRKRIKAKDEGRIYNGEDIKYEL